jgi:hypothetical protein
VGASKNPISSYKADVAKRCLTMTCLRFLENDHLFAVCLTTAQKCEQNRRNRERKKNKKFFGDRSVVSLFWRSTNIILARETAFSFFPRRGPVIL